jgi:hypothetical protein
MTEKNNRHYRKYFYVIAVCLVIFFAIFIPIFIIRTIQLLDDAPYQIHATWNQSNASSSITITWRTDYQHQCIIKYDIIARNNVLNLYSWEKIGVADKFSDISGYINSVTINELEPNQSYYFICGANSGGWSNERRFDTPALNPKQILFVAGGDSQEGIEYRDNI